MAAARLSNWLKNLEARQQVEQELRYSRDEWEQIFACMSDAVTYHDLDHNILRANRAFRALFPEAEIEGTKCYQLVHGLDAPPSFCPMAKSLASGQSEVCEIYEPHLGRHLSIRSDPVKDRTGKIVRVVHSVSDITQRKEVERMKNEFVSTVGHELRTPLASLRGFSELMLKRDFSEEKRREFLTIIHKESGRLGKLINDLLDLQRIESGKQMYRLAPASMEQLLQEAAALFAASENGYQFRLEIPGPLPPVRADADRIRQVLANLISNAVKYSPQGGEVVVGARAQDAELLVWVSDQGVGISPEVLPKLFTKFYRGESGASRGIGGTGLGLALVKEIIELHRGRVWVESSPGRGSTFFFALPLAEEVPRFAPVSLPPPDKTDVLLVENDEHFASLVCEQLQGLKLSVNTTASAEQALELLRKEAPRLVLLDIHLAGRMTGWDLLVTMKGDWRLEKIPVVVVTVTESNARGLALEGAEYLSKNLPPEKLASALRRQLSNLAGNKVLVVDGDPAFRQTLVGCLSSVLPLEIEEAGNGREALERMAQRMPDLLILEVLLPELDGFEVLRRLRADRRAVNLQVLVLTARELDQAQENYVQRKMGTLIRKRQADLESLARIVTQALQMESRTPASTAA